MPNAQPNAESKTSELLEKLLAVKLHSMGVAQSRIARIVKKSKGWVNALLKGIPQGNEPRGR